MKTGRPTIGRTESGHDLLLTLVNGVLLEGGLRLDPSGLFVDPADEVRRFTKALAANHSPRYKARPLNGIGATAPYLHNGSVPTLYDLLNPADQRPGVFAIGSRELDAKKVGLAVSHRPADFQFNTSVQGNWRNGHDFGTLLSRREKDSLLEFLKTL